MQSELTLDEIAVLTVVDREVSVQDATRRAVELWPCTKFDGSVARATVRGLVARGLLAESLSRIAPTQSGRIALKQTLGVLTSIRDAVRNRVSY
jgi:hypothetical protein